MKCIKAVKETKHYKLGEIRRTDDRDAEEKVNSGVFVYIGKAEWKKEVRDLIKPTIKESLTTEQEETISEKQLKRKKKSK